MIETARLRLLPYTIHLARAFEQGQSELGAALEASIPNGWPEYPGAYSRPATEGSTGRESRDRGWGTYLFLLKDGSSLVGSGGYKGPPKGGVVEIGYEIAPPFRNRGMATEAARALIRHAYSNADVEEVQARTLPERNASARVLEKVGMELAGEITDDDGVVWLWRTVGRPT
ncbi:MAG TPA: GNAT family N-acetyltransferase [Actinomycetota bacterium]|nr:GNAT family N-acetyltransferase [Actinomycetota bacterium]